MVKSVNPSEKLARFNKKQKTKSVLQKVLAQCFIWIVLLVMYVPILVLIAYSFTTATNIGTWTGFSFDLYVRFFTIADKDAVEIWTALGNTLIIALTSSLISIILGTCGAIGTFYSKKRWKGIIENVTQIPVVNAEIVIAMSLTIMFVFVQNCITAILKNAGDPNPLVNVFGFWTLIAGHVVLSLPFVYLSVKPKLQQMDPALYEAALDLGCNQRQALMRSVVPEIMPGIASGFLLSVTLSLDDFIVTAFTRGAGLLSGDKTIETLSTLVQAKIKKGPIPTEMRVLTALIFVVVLLIVVAITIYNNRKKGPKIRRGRGTK